MGRKFKKKIHVKQPIHNGLRVILRDPATNSIVAILAIIVAIALAVVFGIPAYEGNRISREAIKTSKCQELRQAALGPIQALSEFLIDPHVKKFNWTFHNNLAREIGPATGFRRLLGDPLKTATDLCAGLGGPVTVSIKGNASVASSFVDPRESEGRVNYMLYVSDSASTSLTYKW